MMPLTQLTTRTATRAARLNARRYPRRHHAPATGVHTMHSAHDTSAVIDADTLDDDVADFFGTPWLFQEPNGYCHPCYTEEQACEKQREYRIAHGFDPITGESD